jgi:hypothetical protein
LLNELVAEDAVSVTQQIAWCFVPRKSLPKLLDGVWSKYGNGFCYQALAVPSEVREMI